MSVADLSPSKINTFGKNAIISISIIKIKQELPNRL